MKQGEVDYLKNIGAHAMQHAYDKPFSDPSCASNLISIGIIMALLPQPPARLLDLGCGTGWTSAFYARRGYRVVGQDIAPDMIRYAEQNRDRYEARDLEFVCSDYESLTFTDPFDCAVFFDALHHAMDERAALASVFRSLRPGGILITHEPGIGHSSSPESIRAMELYGVTEKDMPPKHIRDLCLQIGYSKFECIPDPGLAVQAVYGLDLTTNVRIPPEDRRPAHWWRRRKNIVDGVLRDRGLECSDLCIITK
jgi:SAM-dependent methyltransferase